MEKTKNIVIFILVIIIVLLLSLLVYQNSNKVGLKSKLVDSLNVRDIKSEMAQKVLDTLKKNPDAYLNDDMLRLIMPQGDSIMIYCNGCYVPIKNFYKFANFIMKDSSAVLFENDDYVINYSAPWKTFHIKIHCEKVLQAIREAENKFLEILKINEYQACTMNVKIGIDKGFQDYAKGTPYYLNNYDILSFCGND